MRTRSRLLAALVLVGCTLGLAPAPAAQAHGYYSVLFAHLDSTQQGVVHAQLGLEYDLFIVSVADVEDDDKLFRVGQPAWDAGDFDAMSRAISAHQQTVGTYIDSHFAVSAACQACVPSVPSNPTVSMRTGVPYVFLDVDYTCDPSATTHDVATTFFPADEGYVRGTSSEIEYDLDGARGKAMLDVGETTFSTKDAASSGPSRAGPSHTVFISLRAAGGAAVLALAVVLLIRRRQSPGRSG